MCAVNANQVSFNRYMSPAREGLSTVDTDPILEKRCGEIIKGYQTDQSMITITQNDLDSIPLHSLKTI